MCLLVPLGALLQGGPLNLPSLVLATFGAALIAMWITQINGLTDMTLDTLRSPKSAAAALDYRPWLRSATVTYLGLTGVVLIGLALNGTGRAVPPLLLFFWFGTLYSFNFLSRDPVRHRLKVHWLGHASVGVFGYFGLLAAGLSCASVPRSTVPVIVVYAIAAIQEYSLFLSESSLDSRDEGKLGLRSLGATIGGNNSRLVAVLLWAGSAMAYSAVWLAFPEIDAPVLASALLVYSATIGLFLVTILTRPVGASRSGLGRLCDIGFGMSRITTLVVLILARAVAAAV